MLNRFWKDMPLTFRITIVLLAMMAGSITLVVGAKKAMAASLKPVSIINNDVIKLGDIFDGVKNNADYVIGAAPQPGQDMVLNARTLYRIATALDLSWRPTSTGDQIIIRREATIVPYEAIENSVRSSLKEKGVSGRYNLSINNGRPTMVLPNDQPEKVEVSSLSYDHQKGYFQATLVAPSTDNPLKKTLVSGFVEHVVSVPVLHRNLQNGDIIGKNDIKMIEVPQHKLQHNIVLNTDDLIGMTPRRMSYAGKFIMEGSVEKPQIVKRGDKVTITFKEGPLTLTAKGKALQSGAKGDYVRVTNATSSRTVDAYVIGENQVMAQ